jgi:hypothetical protein
VSQTVALESPASIGTLVSDIATVTLRSANLSSISGEGGSGGSDHGAQPTSLGFSQMLKSYVTFLLSLLLFLFSFRFLPLLSSHAAS